MHIYIFVTNAFEDDHGVRRPHENDHKTQNESRRPQENTWLMHVEHIATQPQRVHARWSAWRIVRGLRKAISVAGSSRGDFSAVRTRVALRTIVCGWLKRWGEANRAQSFETNAACAGVLRKLAIAIARRLCIASASRKTFIAALPEKCVTFDRFRLDDVVDVKIFFFMDY